MLRGLFPLILLRQRGWHRIPCIWQFWETLPSLNRGTQSGLWLGWGIRPRTIRFLASGEVEYRVYKSSYQDGCAR